MPKVKILGIKIDCLNFREALIKLESFVEKRRFHQVVTVNPEFIISAQRDMEVKKILNNVDLSLADGIGVVWASKFLGEKSLKEKVAGTDLVEKIAEFSAQKGYSIYFLGAGPGIAQKAALNLKKKYPKMLIVNAESGSPSDPAIIEDIRKTKPDILLVAFGHPKQEKWLFQNKNKLNVPVCIGVGGAFDFISGRIRRAPLWLQKAGFEWLYRLIRQPWRIKRQLALLKFVWLIMNKKFKQLTLKK